MMLRIALPKGRLGDKVMGLLAASGYDCRALAEDDRRLVLESPADDTVYYLVKPSDVAVYVEHGAADAGIVGRDILLEQRPEVYELLDLGMGYCRMVVAGPEGFIAPEGRPLKVATKFPRIAQEFFDKQEREITLIQLNGSIELAPITRLSDVIVDITESGATLRENHLTELETICAISARLIVNPASARFEEEGIGRLVNALRKQTERKVSSL
ncbi:MAG: ATP phosphoribosyltransferase [Christensenellales bacterium]|jgi:ATP phosphoribosyltransferase